MLFNESFLTKTSQQIVLATEVHNLRTSYAAAEPSGDELRSRTTVLDGAEGPHVEQVETNSRQELAQVSAALQDQATKIHNLRTCLPLPLPHPREIHSRSLISQQSTHASFYSLPAHVVQPNPHR